MINRVRLVLRRYLCKPTLVKIPQINDINLNIASRSAKKLSEKLRPHELRSTHCVVYVNKWKYILSVVPKYNMEDKTDMSIPLPDGVRGMTSLDKSGFDQVISVPAVLVDTKALPVVLKCLKQYQLKISKIRPVVELDKHDLKFSSHKLVLLNKSLVQDWDSFQVSDQELLKAQGVTSDSFQHYDVKVGYDNLTFSDVMKMILPDDCEGVSGFEEVGHIAHFNLRDKTLPYKNIIGEVLLDKTKKLKTVVNKLNTIDSTFRTFQMELMAGQENYVTQTKENGCTFELDYSKVYWNSRLGTEHERIVKGIESTEVVFDVFAGIGPFAIPAAKKGATVFANDLNPHSYEALVNNSKLNKCKNNINCFNLDGREFVKTIIKCELTKLFIKTHTIGDTERNFKVTIIMNLPALAYTFLDAFRSLLEEDAVSVSAGSMPLVHCYCFTDIESAVKDCDGDTVLEVKRRTRGVIGGLNDDDITVRLVRNVAPQKDMVCVSFRLTPDILLNRQDQIDGSLRSENGEPAQKIARLETSTSL